MNLLSMAKRVAAFAALTLTLMSSSVALPQNASSLKFGACSASAAARFQVTRIYFSDATLRTRVGTGVFRCDGSSSLFGRSTPYFVESKEPCCGSNVC